MFNYIAGFSVYTLAMMGIIFIAFVVVKKCSIARKGAKSHNNFLEIETALSLEPRKMVYVLRAGTEKILLATDADKTSFLTKLNENNIPNNVIPIKKHPIDITTNNTKAIENSNIAVLTQTNEEESPPQNQIKPYKMAVNENITKENSHQNSKVFKDLLKRLQN